MEGAYEVHNVALFVLQWPASNFNGLNWARNPHGATRGPVAVNVDTHSGLPAGGACGQAASVFWLRESINVPCNSGAHADPWALRSPWMGASMLDLRAIIENPGSRVVSGPPLRTMGADGRCRVG